MSDKIGVFLDLLCQVIEGFSLLLINIVESFRKRCTMENIEDKPSDSSEYAESIINTVRDPLIVLDHDLKVLSVSRSFYEVFKVKAEDTLGQLIYDLGNKQWNIPKLRELLENILPQKATFNNYEVEHDFSTIGRRIMLLNARQVRRVLGKERIILLSIEDITERWESEEKIKVSLREKEMLLKEIHHRVKNNLQIISSLLKLQSRYIEDENTKRILSECQERITAMASVHSMLYKSQNFAEINFGEYVRDTAYQLFRSYKTSIESISLVIHAGNIMLPIDSAIPCGLIINELATNALKYAFTGVKKGEIKIEMNRTENGLKLIFEDNGIGFPKDVDFGSTETFGLKLVHMLVKQLDGSIEQFINSGTKYVIILKPEKLQEI